MTPLLFVLVHVATLVACCVVCYRMGKRYGQRLEVTTMIEILDALKIDCWEHRIFRDRFKGALQWALDGKRKKDRRDPDAEA